MKKFTFMFAALVLMFMAVKSYAGPIQVPVGPLGALATSEYGGVSIATVSRSSANVLIGGGEVSIVGFIISSMTLSITPEDYVLFRSTTSLDVGAESGGTSAADDYTTDAEIIRVYVSSQNTSANDHGFGQPMRGMTYKFPAPWRWSGVAAKTSFVNYNSMIYLFNRLYPEGSQPNP